jgi:hypothetical protein
MIDSTNAGDINIIIPAGQTNVSSAGFAAAIEQHNAKKRLAMAVDSWRRVFASLATPEQRAVVFPNAAQEVAGFVRRGLDRTEGADGLYELAEEGGLNAYLGDDGVQEILSDAFERAEEVAEVVPDIKGNGYDYGDSFEEACRRDDERRQRERRGEETGATTVSAEEINAMTFNPIKYVVTGYIVEGLTLFAGKPKIGKSWLLLHAAIAVARGGFTLGDVHCQEGDVLYCALEDNLRRLRSRLAKLLQTEKDWPRRLDFVVELPRLAQGGLDFIRQWIRRADRPRLVVIDTLAMVRMPNRKDQSTYDADYAAVKDLRALAYEHNVAIVLVHHLRKAEADDAFDTISGTLGLTGAPDTVMVLRRDNTGTTLHARGRDLTDIEKAVQFDAETCVWTVLGDAGEVRRSD